MKKKILLIALGSIIFFSAGLVVYNYNQLDRQGIVVLLYHKVKHNAGDNKYEIDIKTFEKQLKYLKDSGYKTVLPGDSLRFIPTEEYNKTVMLTFDDGTIDHYKNVFPLLKKYNFNGLFFIVTKYINSLDCVNEEQIRLMQNGGMGIGSHSYSHPLLDAIDYDKMEFQLRQSKEALEMICQKPIVDMAPPGGWFNDSVVMTALNLGYKHIFSCNIGPTNIAENPVIYNRIEVLGDMNMDEFKDLLHPTSLIVYKTEQSIKFIIHAILGSKNYQAWL